MLLLRFFIGFFLGSSDVLQEDLSRLHFFSLILRVKNMVLCTTRCVKAAIAALACNFLVVPEGMSPMI